MKTIRFRPPPSLIAALLPIILGCAAGAAPSMSTWRSAPERPPAISPAPTSSGKAEVMIPGTGKKRVIEALTSKMASGGWNVAQANDYQIVYERDAKGAAGFLSDLFYGGATQPIYRITAQFLEIPEAVKVIAGMELVSNPGTPRTTRTDMNKGKSRVELQDLLQRLRSETQILSDSVGVDH